MSLEAEQKFLRHLLLLIRDQTNTLPPMSRTPSKFEEGKALAYHEVTDFVLECSRIFEVSLAELGVQDLDPDRLLE